jgi:NTP pyrophosphatase (non-canonical NTP hydrolase)
MSDYAEMVAALVKPGADIVISLTAEKANQWHLATGVAGEAGELLDAVKKSAIYNKPLDLENVVEELGDLEFYMEGLRQSIGITRDEVLAFNQAKLSKRYSSGKYSDKQAQIRADKEEDNV